MKLVDFIEKSSQSYQHQTKSLPFFIDQNFRPFISFINEYQESVEAVFKKDKKFIDHFSISLFSNGGAIFRYDSRIISLSQKEWRETTIHFAERILKFLLWSTGAYRVDICSSHELVKELQKIYSLSAEVPRKFDVEIMEQTFGKSFQINYVEKIDDLSKESRKKQKIGGHLKGERIGFDLGASDYKIAAVKDGEVIYSEEIRWNPSTESDPNYHYQKIKEGLLKAKSYLVNPVAIGGSSAGIIIDNQVKIASLFRSVSKTDFQSRVKNIFNDLGNELNLPICVINDGEVTALAGALSLKKNSILGIAFGSSEAAGEIDVTGSISGRLNELAFAPVDIALNAPIDEWSKDGGVGAQYFSQQAVNRLAKNNGIVPRDDARLLPELLKDLQKDVEKREDIQNIFKTIGVYLAYTTLLYHHFYKFENMMILGRVVSGYGGELILTTAQQVLNLHFPDFAKKIKIFIPDEKARRVGQAVAAASLYKI